jgi:hypothetical protein
MPVGVLAGGQAAATEAAQHRAWAKSERGIEAPIGRCAGHGVGSAEPMSRGFLDGVWRRFWALC